MTAAGVKQVLNKATLGEAGGITMQDKCPLMLNRWGGWIHEHITLKKKKNHFVS